MKKRVNLVCLFWFLKFALDLFYQFQIFDIIVLLLVLFLFFSCLLKQKILIKKIDILVIIMMLLYTISFLKDLSYYIDYMKIISCFIMYFIGRLTYIQENKVNHTLINTFILIFVINLFVCAIGKGSVTWGSANTLNGLYYFKTDFACFLSCFLIFWLIDNKINSKVKILITVITCALTILTNARIYYLIISLIILLFQLYKNNKKMISKNNIIKGLFFSIIIIFGISFLSKLPFFSERNLVGLDFTNFDSVTLRGNTQGRNEMWHQLLSNFNNQSLLTKLFGAGLYFKDIYGINGFHEHSTYVKTLINTGYFGLFIFIIFIIGLVYYIYNCKNKRIQYITISLLFVFLIAGISSPTILYSNTSWLPMYYFGISVSLGINDIIEDVMEDKR